MPKMRKKTLHREIYDHLYGVIISGNYGADGRLPTEQQLAQRFKTSRSTVAKAMRELEFVGMIRRQAGAGSFAIPTSSTSTSTFAALLIAGFGDVEFFTPICAQIALSCQKYDISLIFGNAGAVTEISSRGQAEEIGRRLVDQRVSGVFFAPNQWNSSDDDLPLKEPRNHDLVLAEMLTKAGIAVILIDRDITLYPQRSSFDFVGVDNLNAAYEQTRHLFAQGCRRIIHLTRPGMLTTKAARIAGYRAALEHLGLPYDRQEIHTGDPTDPDFVRETLAEKPDGVVCFNDPMATAYLHSLRSLGVDVPRELKVIGVDDLEYAKFLPVPLSTMRQPRKELGELAVDVLLRRLANRSAPPSENLLTTTLVVRESTSNPKSAERMITR